MSKVKFQDWMEMESEDSDDGPTLKPSDDFDTLFAVDKFSKKEKKSQLLLQLQKSYKGDQRF